MKQNRFIEELRNSLLEDINIEEIPDEGFYIDEDTIHLGAKEKEILLNAIEKDPYLLRYFFDHNFKNKEEAIKKDLELLRSLIGASWTIDIRRSPFSGIGCPLTIDDNGVIYSNELHFYKEPKFLSILGEIKRSIDKVEEDIELDKIQSDGKLIYHDTGVVYKLGIDEKLALIELLRELGPTGDNDGFVFPFGTADYMEECVLTDWFLFPEEFGSTDEKIFLFCRKGQNMDIPIKYLYRFVLDTDFNEVLDVLLNNKKEEQKS